MDVNGFAKKFDQIDAMPLEGGGTIRWLITHKDGATTFSMRLINVPKGNNTPAHSHDYEHEIFIIEGEGIATIGDENFNVGKDSFVFIPANKYHTIKAKNDMKMICVVPIKAAIQILGK